MLSPAAKAWLTGLFALVGLLVATAGNLDRIAATQPLTVAEIERQRALDVDRLCAGIVSTEGLEDCIRMTAPVSGDDNGYRVESPEPPQKKQPDGNS